MGGLGAGNYSSYVGAKERRSLTVAKILLTGPPLPKFHQEACCPSVRSAFFQAVLPSTGYHYHLGSDKTILLYMSFRYEYVCLLKMTFLVPLHTKKSS